VSGLGNSDVPRNRHGDGNNLESGLKNGLTSELSFFVFLIYF
jgi:hypothetical protein